MPSAWAFTNFPWMGKIRRRGSSPRLHAYDSWLQYQTYELTMTEGTHTLEAMLGEGWYKGPYG